MTQPPPPLSATERMQVRGEVISAERPGLTVAQVTDARVDEMVNDARNGETVEHCGDSTAQARRFAVGSGPICEVLVVLDEEGKPDYAVIDYSEGAGRAVRVVTDRDAELLFEALWRYGL